MAIIRNAKYVKSDVKNNNNKFWYIEEHDNSTVITKWGRVGEVGQSKSKTFGSQAQASSFYDSKCNEKQRDGRNGEIAYRKLDVVDSIGTTTQKVVA
ncbi:MAG: WGR domain-containing protein, partial [Methanomassiliicoccales archaeon]